jgi:predicted DCC family thiol-disulfide oxidoreductase YuxK
MPQHHTSLTPAAPRFTVFIDGHCPLCRREAGLLHKLDRGRGHLAMFDISEPDFDPSVYGLTHERIMRHIHGLTADGRVVSGVEVFRGAYAAVGLGWLLGWTSLPGVSWLCDRLYELFAWIRPRLPGRGACTDGRCSWKREPGTIARPALAGAPGSSGSV